MRVVRVVRLHVVAIINLGRGGYDFDVVATNIMTSCQEVVEDIATDVGWQRKWFRGCDYNDMVDIVYPVL
jgi:hypothetical protein